MGWDSALFLSLITDSLMLTWIVVPAVLLGIVVGAIPGFSAQNTLIILLPLTLTMDINVALAFMVSLYCATHLGGGIPAILVNMPGTGGAAATTLDGYQMTLKGQAQQALVLCFVASTVGGLVTSIATVALLPYLAQLGLYLRSVEVVAVMVFGLVLIAAIAADDPLFPVNFGLIENWRKANRPVEFHYYEQGGHGFGMYPKETTSTGWFDAFVKWLGMHGYLKLKA